MLSKVISQLVNGTTTLDALLKSTGTKNRRALWLRIHAYDSMPGRCTTCRSKVVGVTNRIGVMLTPGVYTFQSCSSCFRSHGKKFTIELQQLVMATASG